MFLRSLFVLMLTFNLVCQHVQTSECETNSKTESKTAEGRNANPFIDFFLWELSMGNDKGSNFTHPKEIVIEKTLKGKKYSATVSLKDGVVSGVSTLVRSGDATLKKTAEGTTVLAKFGLNTLTTTLNARIAYTTHKFINLDFPIKSTIKDLVISVDFAQGLGPDWTITAKKFEVSQFNVTFEIGSISPFTWAREELMNNVTDFLKTILGSLIDKQLKDTFFRFSKTINVPLA